MINVPACLPFCPHIYISIGNHISEFHQTFLHVACSRGSILLYYSNVAMLCTFNFVDHDFIVMGQMAVDATAAASLQCCVWLS